MLTIVGVLYPLKEWNWRQKLRVLLAKRAASISSCVHRAKKTSWISLHWIKWNNLSGVVGECMSEVRVWFPHQHMICLIPTTQGILVRGQHCYLLYLFTIAKNVREKNLPTWLSRVNCSQNNFSNVFIQFIFQYLKLNKIPIIYR